MLSGRDGGGLVSEGVERGRREILVAFCDDRTALDKTSSELEGRRTRRLFGSRVTNIDSGESVYFELEMLYVGD